MEIDAKTKLVALLGYPARHSFSPTMHNAAFMKLGLNYRYVAFEVEPARLKEAVEGVRALGLAGVNVTVPHKENVIQYLDEVDAEAASIGAVNTIVNIDGRLKGYNTDGRGFMKSLETNGIVTEGKNILIVGSGGAARAIGYYISEKAKELSIFDVISDKAEALAEELKKRGNVRHLKKIPVLKDMDIIINATPLGLKEEDPLPFDLSEIRPDQVIGDLIYKETRLLSQAKTIGCKTFNGLGMLIWQGALAFHLWTKEPPPYEIMRAVLAGRPG